MKVVIDLALRQAITDFGNSTPAQTYTIKSQDTAALNVYFVQGGVVQDLGSATTLKFGLVQSGFSTLLVLDTVFTRLVDSTTGNVSYQGFPAFNTSALLTALGSAVSIDCTGEVRYQQPDGEITHCLDIPFKVYRTILAETTSTTTTANFTQPSVGSNVAVAVVDTSFLSAGDVVSIGTNGDSYSIVTVTDATHFTGENLGTGSTAPAGTILSGSTVSLASPNVLETYPDVSLIEQKTNKDQPGGYLGLNGVGSGYASNTHILVDGVTVTSTDPAGLATANKLTILAASFVQPAANTTVVATVGSSALLALNQAVFILGGGYYFVTGISGTSVTLKNNGDAYNIGSGSTVPSGAALLPAQAVSGSGTAGQNAYTSTSANFTVPSVGSTVTLSVTSTAWMGGNGQVLYIAGAGYYSISTIGSGTSVTVTNLGTSANSIAGTVVYSPATVTPGGATGASGAAANGLAAYDSTTSSFIMPAAAANVSVTQSNTGWLGVGQVVYIATAGYFSVYSITNATTWVATNLNYTGNASVSTVIASASKVSPGGIIGPTGSGGAGKDSFGTLTSSFTQPAVGANVTAVVDKTAWMTVGQTIYIQGGGYYAVYSITDATDVVVTNLGYSVSNPSPGSTITGSGTQAISPGGIKGLDGVSSYTTVTTNFTMPAATSTVTVTVGATNWMAQGQYIFISSAGFFSISSITDATHVVLINLGVVGNVNSGSTVSSGAAVVASGYPGSSSSAPKPDSFNAHVEQPSAKSYTLDLSAAATYIITKLIVVLGAGTCTLALQQNGSSISGASSVSVTTTLQSITLSPSVAIADKITALISSPSGATDLQLAVVIQK